MIINTSKIRPLQIKWGQYAETTIFRADPQRPQRVFTPSARDPLTAKQSKCPFKKGGGQ